MLKLSICILMSLIVVGASSAQDTPISQGGVEKQPTYIVQLTEYRLNQPLDPSRSVAEILEMVSKQGDSADREPIETVRLSTLSGTESLVQFGRRANVTVGKTVSRAGETVRNVQAIDVGTIVRVTATPENGSVSLKLSYESSRLDGNGEEDTLPELTKTQINTTQLLDLGQPNLLGSTTAGSSTIIVVTVTRN